PADPYELWDSPPFEPVLKGNKIYARGSADDKGQMYMHVKAFETMMHFEALPCNVKFLIEGEEEAGSENLDDFVKANREKLAADVVLISDTSIISMDTPSITVGLRGLSYLEVAVTGPNRDLHSGIYGGAVANPINVLCEMIASLKDDKGRITIPGFYDKVLTLSAEERELLNKTPFDLEQYKKDLNIGEVAGEEGFTTLERVGIRPTLDVNGIWGGYTGEGAKTVLPSKARITIPGFYDKVLTLSAEERELLNKTPFDLEQYKKDLNIGEVAGEEGFTTLERVGIRPTLDVNGIWGGYTGEGAKTVLPSKAYAKISMRLVANQDHREI